MHGNAGQRHRRGRGVCHLLVSPAVCGAGDGKADRLILHFGAVDYEASVWVNGHFAVRHEGGYTPFSIDITDLLIEGEQTVIIRAR